MAHVKLASLLISHLFYFASVFFPLLPQLSNSSSTLLSLSAWSSLYLLALSQADTTHSVVAEGFQLSTERRAKERLEFEQTLKDKEALRAQMEEQQAREQEEREKEEITRLRQEQVYQSCFVKINQCVSCVA